MYLTGKMTGYIVYAIGIIGGVEGVTLRGKEGVAISLVSLVVIVAGSYLLDKK